jgi:hypothetical protein
MWTISLESLSPLTLSLFSLALSHFLSFFVSIFLETRGEFDKTMLWEKHQNIATLFLHLMVLAISLVDYKDLNSEYHTPPGVDLLCRLGFLAQELTIPCKVLRWDKKK